MDGGEVFLGFSLWRGNVFLRWRSGALGRSFGVGVFEDFPGSLMARQMFRVLKNLRRNAPKEVA